MELKIFQNGLDKEIRTCGDVYNTKLERNLNNANSKEVSMGLQVITGYKCDNLNRFHDRFDVDSDPRKH